MNIGPVAIDALGLTPQEREALQASEKVRDTLAQRLSYCGASVNHLRRESLVCLVRGHLRDILDVPIVVRTAVRGAGPFARVTDDELERRYWEVLRCIPARQRNLVRERLRRMMNRESSP